VPWVLRSHPLEPPCPDQVVPFVPFGMASFLDLACDLADLRNSLPQDLGQWDAHSAIAKELLELQKAKAYTAPHSFWGRQLSEPVKVADLTDFSDSFFSGRQISEPAHLEGAGQVQWTPDLGDPHMPWRQTSEPVKVYMTSYAKQGLNRPQRGKTHEDAAELDEDDVPTTSPSTGSGDESIQTSSCHMDSPCLSFSEAVPRPPGLPGGRTTKDPLLPRWVGQHGLQEKPVQPKLPGHAPKGNSSVTISGLPKEYTEQLLLEEFRDAGFVKPRDFDYFDFSPNGYCIVNFIKVGVMRAFIAAFEGRSMRHADSETFSVRAVLRDRVRAGKTDSVWQRAHAPKDDFCPNCMGPTQLGFNFCMQCGMCLKSLH